MQALNEAWLKKISEYQQEKKAFVSQKEQLSRSIYILNQEKSSLTGGLTEASAHIDNMGSQLITATENNQMLFKSVSDMQKDLSSISKKNSDLAFQAMIDKQKIKDLNSSLEEKNTVIAMLQCMQASRSENQSQFYNDPQMLRFSPVVQPSGGFFYESMQIPDPPESDYEKQRRFGNGFVKKL